MAESSPPPPRPTPCRPGADDRFRAAVRGTDRGAALMEIADLLIQRGVIPQLRVGNKKQALQEIARRAAPMTGVAERRIYDVLAERERLGSTGIGRGIAIPHGKLVELSRLYGLFARLERPIAFEAIDDQPIDLVFVLLAPAASGAEHLRALARVSRLLRDAAICQKLRGTDNADALYALLTDRTESHAA
jgi:nitrogen PTS system EIIA component